jgi:hypothetical protein
MDTYRSGMHTLQRLYMPVHCAHSCEPSACSLITVTVTVTVTVEISQTPRIERIERIDHNVPVSLPPLTQAAYTVWAHTRCSKSSTCSSLWADTGCMIADMIGRALVLIYY